MKTLFALALGLMLAHSGFGQEKLSKNLKSKKPSNYSYFVQASKEISVLLGHPIFKKYPEYTIESVRQGELGESQAYFVRLVKPFSDSDMGVCFAFNGTSEVQGQPHPCKASE